MKIVIAENAFEPASWQEFEAEDLLAFLVERYGIRFPDNARIYNGNPSLENDVTPHTEDEIERLKKCKGPIFVVNYPEGPALPIIAIILTVIAIAASVYMFLTIPNAASKSNNTSSPNNDLSDRQNSARPNGRIPDIFGKVLATPDLIAVPYKTFDDKGVEFELCYMCVGRGEYDIVPTDIFEDTTPFSNIAKASLEIYGPNTSPNSGDSAILTIGDAIATEVVNIASCSSVNGQTLYPPNYKSVTGDSSILFGYPNIINTKIGSGVDWTDYFEVGDDVTVTNAAYDDGAGHAVDLAGVYTVTGFANSNRDLLLDSPDSINTDWDVVNLMSGNKTAYISPTVEVDTDKTIGPLILVDTALNKIQANFVAQSGLYEVNGAGKQLKLSVGISLTATPIDASNTPTGSPETFTFTFNGSALDRGFIGATMVCSPTFTGRCSIVIERTSTHDYSYGGNIQDEIKLRDLYSISPLTPTDFGNATTVQTKTVATQTALAIASRKLNMYTTRKVPARVSGSTFGSNTATVKADAIICALATDDFIGRRNISEVDVDNVYNTVASIISYFGIDEAAEFSYTFDKTNMTFEETIATVASAIFCTAYRRGNQIKLSFEQATTDSTILFNHRNKKPGSEQRTTTFGWSGDYDGIEYQYVDPLNLDIVATLYFPTDKSATNPNTIQSIGVRNLQQATLQGNRLYNKMRYQNTSTQFDATSEAELLVRMDRILVADDTRPETQAGEILAQNVLQLSLSQPFVYTSLAHTIHLQLYDGSTQAIAIDSVLGGSGTRDVVLAGAPDLDLQLGNDLYAPTTYVIVGNSDPRSVAFLVDSRTADNTVTAINYDSRYYSNDLDFA